MKYKRSLYMFVFGLFAVSCTRGEVQVKEVAVENQLTPLQYKVTQECGTEPPFSNAFWDNHEAGWYVDVVSGVPLFRSEDKFDSGTGWPSFTRPFASEAVKEVRDSSAGMIRTEVRSTVADSHLGHVFDDGPGETGLRYCINSAALRFIPHADLERSGYGPYLSAQKGYETALFAAGCFWGTEGYFRQLKGVRSTEVGYSGGWMVDPDYKTVTTGKTGHAESLRIDFDPSVITYRELLFHFFRMHDPGQKDRQGNDIGSQYRSAIFTLSAEQEGVAAQVRDEVSRTQRVVTEIRSAGAFYSAEEYHQDYLVKNPGGYCHVDLSLAHEPLVIPGQ